MTDTAVRIRTCQQESSRLRAKADVWDEVEKMLAEGTVHVGELEPDNPDATRVLADSNARLSEELAQVREENEQLRVDLRTWVKWAEDKGPWLDEYREMGQKLAAMEDERDRLRAEVARLDPEPEPSDEPVCGTCASWCPSPTEKKGRCYHHNRPAAWHETCDQWTPTDPG